MTHTFEINDETGRRIKAYYRTTPVIVVDEIEIDGAPANDKEFDDAAFWLSNDLRAPVAVK